MAESEEQKKDNEKKKHEESFDEEELEAIERNTSIPAPAIFEAIRREGAAELRRPNAALMMSGLVAGIALGFSVLSEALFRTYLPDAPWRPLVENLGYSVGFLIVIIGQMQLFTENTITAVCPALDDPSREVFMNLGRLWALVLAFNLIGAIAFGGVLYASRTFQPDVWAAIVELSRHATEMGAVETLWRGVGAGWLVAALVWMMHNSEGNKTQLIIIITYIIALADFTHVVAGTTEAAVVVLGGHMDAWTAAVDFTWPALVGNVLGGTVVFTFLAWTQIRVELVENRRHRAGRRG